MIEILCFASAGVFGALVRQLVTGEGTLALPEIHQHRVNLGFVSGMIIGAFAGVIAPYELGVDCVVAALSGYVGQDLTENLIERRLGKRVRRGKRA